MIPGGMRDSNGPGEVYIVQTPHCIHLHTSVYKTGRAHDSGERLKGYPKGTKLLCCLPVSRMKDAEGTMLGSCRGDADILERRDFGSEYFECSLGRLIGKLVTVSEMFSWSFRETTEHGKGKGKDEDTTVLLAEFVRVNIAELASKSPVDSAVLLDRVTHSFRASGCARTLSLKALTRDLCKYCSAEEILCHRFSQGPPRHAIRFRQVDTQVQVHAHTHAVPCEAPYLDPIGFFKSFARVSDTGTASEKPG